MDYFTVDFPSGTKLGISVIRRSEQEPNLGITLVENVSDLQGFASKNGIRAGDFIIGICGWYVAHLPHEDCIKALQSALKQRRGVSVTFCRPNPTEWTAFLTAEDRVLHEGILLKVAGILRRKSTRYVKLTKLKIQIEKGRDDIKDFPISSLTLSVSSPSIGSNPRASFSLILNSSETEFDCGDTNSCMMWQHAIHSATKEIFSKPLSKFYMINSAISSGEAAAASDASKKSQTSLPYPDEHAPPKYAVEVPKFTIQKQRGSQRSVGGNPYTLLMFTKVKVHEKFKQNEGKVDTAKLPDPKDLFEDNVEVYDFALEKQILRNTGH